MPLRTANLTKIVQSKLNPATLAGEHVYNITETRCTIIQSLTNLVGCHDSITDEYYH